MIGSDLLRYADKQRFLIHDFETESLNLFAARPWQLSYALCTNKYIDKVITRYPLYTDINVSDEAARITRFDKKHYLSVGEDPVKVLADFEEIALDPSVLLLGHNVLGYDRYIWRTMRRLQGKPIGDAFNMDINSRLIDTLCLSRAYRHGIVPDLKDYAAWQYKALSIKGTRAKGMGCSLGAMAREFQIPYDERLAHDATYDTNVNFEVFKKLIIAVEV